MKVSPSTSRRRFLRLGAGAAAGCVVAGSAGWLLINRERNLFQVRQSRPLMETSVSVNVLTHDMDYGRDAINRAFARMADLVAVFNRFDPASPVARLNRAGRLTEPPLPLHTVLDHALKTSVATDGDFDVTVSPVLDYYLGLPRPVAIAALNQRVIAAREALVDYRHIRMDATGIRLLQPGMGITLDGIAKGYVIDRGIAALRDAGIEDALIDAGGEIRAIAGVDPSRFWNVGIVDPHRSGRIAAVVRLRNAALSTSGNYEVFFSSDRRLFHIINPHTGRSPDRYSSVTVMAQSAIESDAMSVAAFSMTPPRLRQVMAMRNHQWLVFSWDGQQRWRSSDLPLVSGTAAQV